jgi:hypothetical protein
VLYRTASHMHTTNNKTKILDASYKHTISSDTSPKPFSPHQRSSLNL